MCEAVCLVGVLKLDADSVVLSVSLFLAFAFS